MSDELNDVVIVAGCRTAIAKFGGGMGLATLLELE